MPDVSGAYSIVAIVSDACNPMPTISVPRSVSAGACPALTASITSSGATSLTDTGNNRVMLTGTVNGQTDLSLTSATWVSWTFASWPTGDWPAGVLSLMPAIDNGNSLSASFIPLLSTESGAYVVNLTVTDGCSTVTVQQTINVDCSLANPVNPSTLITTSYNSRSSSTGTIDIPYLPNVIGALTIDFIGKDCNNYKPFSPIPALSWSRWAEPWTVSYQCAAPPAYPVRVISVFPAIIPTLGRQLLQLVIAVGSNSPGIPAGVIAPDTRLSSDQYALTVFITNFDGSAPGAVPQPGVPCFGVTIIDAGAGKITCTINSLTTALNTTSTTFSAGYSVDVTANGVSSRDLYASGYVEAAPSTVTGVSSVDDGRVMITGWGIAYDATTNPSFRPELSVYNINGYRCVDVQVVPAVLFQSLAAITCRPTVPLQTTVQQFMTTASTTVNITIDVSVTLGFRDLNHAVPAFFVPIAITEVNIALFNAMPPSSATVSSGGVIGIAIAVVIVFLVVVGVVAWLYYRRTEGNNTNGIPTRTNPLFDRRTSSAQTVEMKPSQAGPAVPPRAVDTPGTVPPTTGPYTSSNTAAQTTYGTMAGSSQVHGVL